MEAALDTSGCVARPPTDDGHTDGWVSWTDLTPFAQGFIEAMWAGRKDWPGKDFEAFKTRGYRPLGFSDLSPEALARIIADCAAIQGDGSIFFNTTDPKCSAAGARCWRDRQNGALPGFPPLTPYLADDGKVHLREASK